LSGDVRVEGVGADEHGVRYQAAWEWFRDVELLVAATKAAWGTILVANHAKVTVEDGELNDDRVGG
jgi:hypothetical protein